MPPEQQYCVICSKERQIDEIHDTVKEIHKRLFVGNGDDSIVTQLALAKAGAIGAQAQIEKLQKQNNKISNRWWDFTKLLIAAALPILILWLAGRL